MRKLIPYFIAEKFQSNLLKGHFEASVMFADISGFTAMTRRLSVNGKEGAEVLNGILGAVFEPVIALVDNHGGYIASFEGDAFTAVFPDPSHPIDCCFAAAAIQKVFKSLSNVKTRFGDFSLSVRIGMAFGQVEWGIIGPENYKTWFFRGEAIEGAIRAEKRSSSSQSVLSRRLYTLVADEIEADLLDNGYRRLREFKDIDPERGNFLSEDIPDEVASRFLPRSVIEYRLEGEFREVICCFISFRQTNPDSLPIVLSAVAEIDGYFEGLNFSDKGANCLVIFGAPISREDDALRSAMLSDRIRRHFGTNIRIGMACGTVFAGMKGSERRAIYGVIGDTVNLAARFMMKAEWGDVWTDDNLRGKLEYYYDLERLRLRKVKGFEQRVAVNRLYDRKVFGVKSLYRGAISGRDVDLLRLQEWLQPFREGRFSGVVLIYGKAGIGKSRLIYELLQRENRKVLTLQCDSVLKKSLNPFVYLLNQYFEQEPGLSNETRREKFEAHFETFSAKVTQTYHSGRERKEAINNLQRIRPFLGAIIGLHWAESIYEDVEPKDRPSMTRFALKDFIVFLSRLEPVILHIEDVHWLDDESNAVFPVLTRGVENHPILIIASGRILDDGSKPALVVDDNVPVQEMLLTELTDDASKAIIANRLGRPPSPKLTDYILSRTEGNPFYTEQFCHYLSESKLIEVRDGITHLKRKPIDLPSGINAILVARIDRLSQELKKIVQAASVLGREFQVKVLARLLDLFAQTEKTQGQGSEKIKPLLVIGETQHIWSFMNELSCLFSHVLLRDAAYEMQLKARLRVLHQLAGEIIEEFFSEDKSYFADTAYHFDRAENAEKAAEYYIRAGDHEKDAYHFNIALEQFRRALELTSLNGGEKHPDTAMIYCNIGTVLGNKGDYRDALEHHFKGLTIRTEIVGEKHPDTMRSYREIALIYNLMGNYAKALENYRKALDISLILSGEFHSDSAWLYNNIGGIHWSRGAYNESLKYSLKALNIYEAIGQNRQLDAALTYINIATSFWSQGDFEKALGNYRAALDIHLEKLGDRHPTTALSYLNMGVMRQSRGEYDWALQEYVKALEIYLAAYGDRHPATASTYLNLGNVWWSKDDADQALEYYLKALNIKLEMLGEKHPDIARSYLNIGSAYWAKGDIELAEEYYSKSLKLRLEILGEKHPDTARSHFNLGSVFQSKEEYGVALEHLVRSLNIRLETIGDKHPQTSLSYQAVVNCCLGMKDLEKSDHYLSRWIAVCRKHDLAGHDFDLEYLQTRLAFARKPDTACVGRLLGLLSDDLEPEQTADIHWEAAQMKRELGMDDANHRAEAARLYRELYAKSPKIEYRKRFEGIVA